MVGRLTGVCVVLGLALAVIGARQPDAPTPTPIPQETVDHLDRLLAEAWRDAKVSPAPAVDELRVLRRLSQNLHGSLPSLQQIRQYEALADRPDRLAIWLDTLLLDRRYADYIGERLARAMASTLEDGPFLLYRRRRFASWLADQIHANRPFDAIVREVISAEGVWTDNPATNYVTGQNFEPIRLAGKTTRAFLGLRIDCAQCHDHPFVPEWKQTDFHGLAAFFGQVESGLLGVRDQKTEPYTFEEVKTKKQKPIEPKVPFLTGNDPGSGRLRERLAAWVTSSGNPYFSRAVANRMWALLFGKGLVEPIDDIRSDAPNLKLLDALAADFRENGHDLRRLIRVLVNTKAFALASEFDGDVSDDQVTRFAAYPSTRLRPEQLAGAVIQVSSLKTMDYHRALLVRVIQATTQNDFVDRFGDNGAEEMLSRGGNIPQRLLMMNGGIVHERIKGDIFTAAGRIGALAPDDLTSVETAFLVCLSRKPTEEESAHFVGELAGTTGDERGHRMEDLFWALINSTEFCWSH